MRREKKRERNARKRGERKRRKRGVREERKRRERKRRRKRSNVRKIEEEEESYITLITNMAQKKSLKGNCNTLNIFFYFNHDYKFSSQNSIKNHFVFCCIEQNNGKKKK